MIWLFCWVCLAKRLMPLKKCYDPSLSLAFKLSRQFKLTIEEIFPQDENSSDHAIE